MRLSKQRRIYIEQKLHAMGLPGSIEEARRIVVTKRYFKRNPFADHPIDNSIPPYQYTFEEFKTSFASVALDCTKYKSVEKAEMMLRGWYEKSIIEAVKEGKERVSIDGIEMIRFRVDQMQTVKDYCRRHRINLD